MIKVTRKRSVCPACKTDYSSNIEAQSCLDMYGECFSCRFSAQGPGSKKGTLSDMNNLMDEIQKRYKTGSHAWAV